MITTAYDAQLFCPYQIAAVQHVVCCPFAGAIDEIQRSQQVQLHLRLLHAREHRRPCQRLEQMQPCPL